MSNNDFFLPRRSAEERDQRRIQSKLRIVKTLLNQEIVDQDCDFSDLGDYLPSLGKIREIHGSLNLDSTNIKDFGNLKLVKGDLWLNNTRYLKSLPDNLTVQMTLELNGSKLPKLPKNLTVGELSLSNSIIKELPDDLKVVGYPSWGKPNDRPDQKVISLSSELEHIIDHNPAVKSYYEKQLKGHFSKMGTRFYVDSEELKENITRTKKDLIR